MRDPKPFVDIHCHLVPGIDDGAKDWEETLIMARSAVSDGFTTVIVTPHQLGNFARNDGEMIRERTTQLQEFLDDQNVPLHVAPGGDVRIEPDLAARVERGEVLTLADQRRHLLLELPHEIYFPLEPVLAELRIAGLAGILSHPERNHGILDNPRVVERLVDAGCLMQVTAGSLTGAFGPDVQRCAEGFLQQGLIHLIATDAHGPRVRRLRMRPAFQRVLELTDWQHACLLCCDNPSRVAAGESVAAGRTRSASRGIARFFGFRRAG